jgi:hypothetical protein
MACATVISAHLAIAAAYARNIRLRNRVLGRGDDGAAVIGTEIPSRSVYKLPPFAPPHLAHNGWPEWPARAREETLQRNESDSNVRSARIKSEMKNR